MTTVGVAMSVHNGASTVDQALASVAGQSRPPDAVVVVDDGSTDQTATHVEAWSRLLPLEMVRHETNRGVAEGRMSAIADLGTDLVVALDADDVWLPHHLHLLVSAYQARPAIVSPTAVAWTPDSTKPIDWGRRLQRTPRERDVARLLVMNWIFSGALFERGAFDAAGGCYRFSGCEDWDLWLRMCRAGVPVTVLDEPTVLYRKHEGSLSADDRVLHVEVQVLETFLKETSDPDLRSVAARSLRHRRARQALRRAYDRARGDQRASARLAALGALRGPRPVAVRALAMMVAPRLTLGQRDRARGLSGS